MTEITKTLTSYRCDWEPCGLRSYISNDGLPAGWVGNSVLRFKKEYITSVNAQFSVVEEHHFCSAAHKQAWLEDREKELA